MAKREWADRDDEAGEVRTLPSAPKSEPAPQPKSSVAQTVIQALESAQRHGTDKDSPEGTRWIVMSETLTQRLIGLLRSL